MSAPDYPIELEQWWLDHARAISRIRGKDACLASFQPDAGRLSDVFTTDRSAEFADYTASERLLAAYGLFYFPQTYVRAQCVLREWTGRHPVPSGPLRILDLGCGPGSGAFAALRHFPERPAIELRAVDRSRQCLARLRDIFENLRRLWPNVDLRTTEGDLLDHPVEENGKWDLVCVSFALNETVATDEAILRWIGRIVGHLTPTGALMILEPAGVETSTRIERLRDAIAHTGSARILGPCLHHRPCPLLGGSRWCHEVRRWQIPYTVSYLNRHLFRSVEDVKFSFLLLSQGASHPAGDSHEFRMIAPMSTPKGKLTTVGCNAAGQAINYEMLTRALDRADLDSLKDLERGDIVVAENVRHLVDEKTMRAERLRCRFSPRG